MIAMNTAHNQTKRRNDASREERGIGDAEIREKRFDLLSSHTIIDGRLWLFGWGQVGGDAMMMVINMRLCQSNEGP